MSFCILTVAFICIIFECTVSIRPYRLRVEYSDNPYGIDVTNPRFFWSVDTDNIRGGDQTAYEIKVYNISSDNTKTLVIDSGKITSNSSSQIKIKGFTITSHTDYMWNVIVYNSSNIASTSNPNGYFSAALVNGLSDWKNASWVGISKYQHYGNAFQIRNSNITLNKQFNRIKCYIAMPGYYKAWINNQRIGDYSLGYFTTFQKRIYYDSFDCTSLFRVGQNVFGIWLGNGWYSQPSVNVGPPMFKLLIRIEYSDNTIDYLKSNGMDYYQHEGPIRMNDIYIGEWYDATYETPGWLNTDYDYKSNGWTQAEIIASPTVGVLSSSAIMPKSRKVETYSAITLTEPGNGIFVFDMGQNVAGLTRIKITGNDMKGQNITLIHSEEIDVNGFVVQMYGNSPMIGTYTMRGDGEEEVFEASFTYYGFQYVQVEGYPANAITQNCIESFFIHTDMDTSVGSIDFSPSNINQNGQNGYLLNTVQHMTRYSSLSNFINIPTDCPQRERRGWMGDAQLSALTTIHNFDMAASYTKWMKDVQDSQSFDNSKGALPDCVPYYGHGSNPGDPSWTTAYTFIIYWMWKYYGDETIISEHYDSLKLQLQFLETQLDSKTGLLPNSVNHYGDWCALVPNGGCAHKSGLISTYDWSKQCLYFSEMAQLMNNANDATAYNTKYENSKKAIYNNYWDAKAGAFVDPINQAPPSTLNAMALELGVLTDANEIASTAKSIADYEIAHDSHLNAGIIGVKYIYPELCKYGYCDLAMNVTLQTTMPSYGYWYEQKATTLWENWQSSQYHASGSKNHIMFGAQSGWYYQYLAGIRQTSESRNWETIIIDPYTNATIYNITTISSSINTYTGLLSVTWTTNMESDSTCDGNIGEGATAVLKCDGSNNLINGIIFADYGTPSGTCNNFRIDNSCSNNNSMSVVSKLCLNKNSCSIPVSNNEFGYDPCVDIKKHLDVQVDCINNSSISNMFVKIDVNIPSGSMSNVYLRRNQMMINGGNPSIDKWMVKENGIVIWENMKFNNNDKGVINGEVVDDSLMFTTQSGQYTFTLYSSG